MACLETSRDVLQAQAAIGKQNDQVIDQVRGFVDGFLLAPSGRSQGEFDAFFTNFLRDAFRPGRSKSCRVTLLSAALESVVNDGFEFGDEGDIRFIHVVLSGTKLGTVFNEVLLEVGDRDFGTMKHARGQGAVDFGLDKHFEKVPHCAGTA